MTAGHGHGTVFPSLRGVHGRPARGESARRVRMPKLPNGSPRALWEEVRTASKCSSMRSGRLGSRQNPELAKMRTSASEGQFPSLPKISASVRAASFEEIFKDAQRRAQHRRVQERKKSEETGERLPFVSTANINKNTISGFHAFTALLRSCPEAKAQSEIQESKDIANIDLEAERAAEAEEKRKAEEAEIERMTRLTMLASSALTEQTDQDMKREDAAIQRARMERAHGAAQKEIPKLLGGIACNFGRENQADVAELLRPPDFGLVVERFHWDGPGLSEKELRKAEEQFHIYKTEGQGDVHLDRLYELLTSLFYMTIDEAVIKKLVKEITPFSALEKQDCPIKAAQNHRTSDELYDFLRKYTQYERDYIRTVFQEFDEDGSGELNTNEVQAVLEAIGCSPFRGTLQRLIEAVDVDHSQTLDFNEFACCEEVRQLYRTFCRFAVEDPHSKTKKVPEHRLTAALIFEFGAQAAELARTGSLASSTTSKIMKTSRSPWKLAAASIRPALGEERGTGLTFRQFTAWSRRMKEAEIAEYVRQFKKFDQSGDGVLDRAEVKTLLAEMGYTPMRSNVDDLFQAVDTDEDNTINLEEYLDVMDYFKKWDGFTGDQAEELQNLFNRYKDSNGEVSSIQTIGMIQAPSTRVADCNLPWNTILDIFRSRGVNVSLRKIQQLVAKVDVDGTHSVDFKDTPFASIGEAVCCLGLGTRGKRKPEFLRLMRLQRESELTDAKEAFFLTLQETLPAEEFAKIEDSESLTIRPEDLMIPVHILNIQTDSRELKRLAPKYTEDGKVDFDNLVGLIDELRRLRLAESRKQAHQPISPMHDFSRRNS
eukprot:s1873_g5.t1